MTEYPDDPVVHRVFKALGDPTRRRILGIIVERPGIRIQELTPEFPISRFAVMKHVNVLEAAGLVRRERRGVSKHLHADLTPLGVVPRWIDELWSRAGMIDW